MVTALSAFRPERVQSTHNDGARGDGGCSAHAEIELVAPTGYRNLVARMAGECSTSKQ